MVVDYGDGGMLGEIWVARQAVCEFGVVEWGRCEREKVIAVRLMSNEEDEMENRAENALQRIAALRLCPHCGGTGWEPDSQPPECRVCEGMRVVPALSDRQAQVLAQETLALIKMHRGSADGDS